ncbi:radical SAM family heme chaperone HemW [Desulfovibrio subterraneus]|uniref:radical SAM family heme chaperone HemW n=1 Tax=Desulfovibrio subterraneus TaxID=2718620 RepID=UPI0022B8D314|nr:radical SAM family heme chaperone HemW [Desulfovibrio subterraneus]WBF66680.1 radical SAM family heme chaperone HemW [Desulfovibrio subterraneus]
MLVYIHVPFCRSKCGYCAFHSEVPQGDAMQRYVDALLREVALWGDRLGNVPVETVFFGGGTPSMLPARAVAVVMDRIRKAFAVDRTAEVSLEANPESVANMDYMKTLLDAGVNRLSMGFQSMNPASLRQLGRPHSVRDAIRTFELARTMGFANINLDFIWGLPDQRLKLWLEDLRAIVRLGPDHLSCYGLTIEEGTPLELAVQKGRLTLPDDGEQGKMFIYGADYLESQGYLQYEISNFARMGFQCRHNMGYWEGADYLGMGPAAVSTLQGRRWTNPCALDEYAATVDAGTIGHDAETLTLMERVQELVMLRLRTTRGLRVKAYRELTGRDFIRDNKSLIHALHRNQLVRIRNGYLSLTRNGLLVSNAILERFFSEMETVLGDSRPVSAKEPEVLGNGSGPGSASGQGDGQGSDRERGRGNDRGSGQENRLSGPEQKEGSTAAPEHGQGGGSH